MSLLIDRLQSSIMRELSILMQRDTKDNNLRNIAITEVRVTNDLSYATVYFSIIGDQGILGSCLEELNKVKGYYRNELAKKVKARKMPQLVFKYDEALAYGNKINKILGELNVPSDDNDD